MKFGKFELELLPGPTTAGTRPVTTELMVTMLKNSLKFAIDKQSNLYVYENGVYRPVEMDVYTCCMAIYARYDIAWTTQKDNQVFDYLVKSSPQLLETPLGDRINLLNGIYFLDSNRFEPHSEIDHSGYLTTVQLPIKYDPTATCPQIDKFMREVLPEGPELLYDVIGVCMVPISGQAKAVVLLGNGSNGKSVYLYGLRAIIGRHNVSTLPMHTLGDSKDRFANAGLIGMLANAADDMSRETILETANIKSIISGNPIRVEGKYKAAVTYTPFCKLIFGSNHRLTANDETTGYMRRIMHIPFNQTFAPSPNKERELHAAFNDTTEQSGLFNEVVKRLKDTIDNGFNIPETARDLVDNFVPMTEEVKRWMKDNIVEDPEYSLPMYQLHLLCARLANNDVRASVLFGQLKSLFPGIMHKRITSEGRRVMGYQGIRLINPLLEPIMMNTAMPEGVIEDIGYLDPDNTANGEK